MVLDFVAALAWPLVVAFGLMLFRAQIRQILGRQNTSVKIGPFELRLRELQAEVAAAGVNLNHVDSSIDTAQPRSVAADSSPAAAIVESHRHVEDALKGVYEAAGLPVPNKHVPVLNLALDAEQRGIIPRGSADTVKGLTVLRNLAMDGLYPIDSSSASQYATLSDAVVYTLQHPPTPQGRAPGGG